MSTVAHRSIAGSEPQKRSRLYPLVTTDIRFLALPLLGLAPACVVAPDVKCGDGTVERDGECVATGAESGSTSEAPSTGQVSTVAASAVDDDGSDGGMTRADDVSDGGEATDAGSQGEDGTGAGGDGEGDGTGPAAGPYGPCPSGSDLECEEDESCHSGLDACAALCFGDEDCPLPSTAGAFPICVSFSSEGTCVISCAGGGTCPPQMSCVEDGALAYCVWM